MWVCVKLLPLIPSLEHITSQCEHNGKNSHAVSELLKFVFAVHHSGHHAKT